MEYTKLSDTEVEVKEIITKTNVLTLDQLAYDKDSLERTIIANNEENDRNNQKIQAMINDINLQMYEFRNVGALTSDEVIAIKDEVIAESIIPETKTATSSLSKIIK